MARPPLVLLALLGACADVRALDGDCRRSGTCALVHPPGFADPAQPGFHGELVRSLGYDLSLCSGCHGADFAGGSSGVSCLGCHAGGPTACTTCHGEPPATGAHATHAVPGALGKRYDCSECHTKPLLYTDAGHLTHDGAPKDHADVAFGVLASRGARLPSYDAATGACANVYCHGDASPRWSDVGKGAAACGTCHGLPPSSHRTASCPECHQGVTDGSLHVTDTARHLDGRVDVGDNSGTCTACHGGPSGPAPPRDLSGASDPASVGVGAHQAHLLGTHRLRGPIACGECHLVPATLHSPGHLDHDPPARVFPDGAGVLARAGGATPAWDHQAARCTNAYCHGSAAPLWTGGTPEAQCGTCHGVPPADSNHTSAMTLASCATCHPDTVDAGGAILVTNGTSFHINGVVDAR
jgi:predicted CxxxxCH...CXXCH cytochrome family protein